MYFVLSTLVLVLFSLNQPKIICESICEDQAQGTKPIELESQFAKLMLYSDRGSRVHFLEQGLDEYGMELPYLIPSDVNGIGKESFFNNPSTTVEFSEEKLKMAPVPNPDAVNYIMIKIFVNESNCAATDVKNLNLNNKDKNNLTFDNNDGNNPEKVQLLIRENQNFEGYSKRLIKIPPYAIKGFDPYNLETTFNLENKTSQGQEDEEGKQQITTTLKNYIYYIDDNQFNNGKYKFYVAGKSTQDIYDTMELNVRRRYMFTPSYTYTKEVDLGEVSGTSLIHITVGRGTYGGNHLEISTYTEKNLDWKVNLGSFVSVAPKVKIVLARNTYHNYKTVSTYPFQHISSIIEGSMEDWTTEDFDEKYKNRPDRNVDVDVKVDGDVNVNVKADIDRDEDVDLDIDKDKSKRSSDKKGNFYSMNIGNDVWIGEGVILINDITIGDGAVLGAYSVVREDVPPYAVVMGNPAKIIKYRFSSSVISQLLALKWWTWKDDVLLYDKNLRKQWSITDREKIKETDPDNINGLYKDRVIHDYKEISHFSENKTYNIESQLRQGYLFNIITKYETNLESFIENNK